MDALKLETINTEKPGKATFGNKKQEVPAVNLVELALSKPETGFELTLNAFSVPHICIAGARLELGEGELSSLTRH